MPYLDSTPPKAPHNYDDEDALWQYTENFESEADERRRREVEAGHKDRHRICRDSRIDGGVYEGAYGGEAIVVDSEKYPLVELAVEEIISKITSPSGTIKKSAILSTVYRYVTEHMRYDSQAVDGIFKDKCDSIDHQKIALDVYIGRRAGVCRHQALFAAAMLEKLSDKGIVRGSVSIDRNMIRNGADGKYDGHAWVRYTNSAGKIFILDVAQKKAAALDELMARRRAGEKIWDYGRAEDHARLKGRGIVDAYFYGETGKQPKIIESIPDWIRNRPSQ